MSLIARVIVLFILSFGVAVPASVAQTADPIFATLATDDQDESKSALAFSIEQRNIGHPVTMYLDRKAVRIASRDNSVEFADQQKSLEVLVAKGASVLVCEACLKPNGVTEFYMVAGVRVGYRDAFVKALSRPNTRIVSSWPATARDGAAEGAVHRKSDKLFVGVPDYWDDSKIIHERTLGPDVTVVGRIPATQSKTDYEESVWVMRFPNLPRPLPITQFANEMLRQYHQQCEALRTTLPVVKGERGYEVAYVQATCNRVKTERHKAILVRAKYLVKGNNYYSVAHEFSFQSFDAVPGAPASVIIGDALGPKAKQDRFARYMEQSTKYLEGKAYICVDDDAACQ